jgi:hypothetical protein
VARVYASTAAGDDLLMIGKVDMDFKNGNSLTVEFIARIIVDDAGSSEPRMKMYKVWTVSQRITQHRAGLVAAEMKKEERVVNNFARILHRHKRLCTAKSDPKIDQPCMTSSPGHHDSLIFLSEQVRWRR